MTKRKTVDDPWQIQGKLTDSLVAALTPPPATGKGHRIRWDGPDGMAGFGARVTHNGAKSFVLRYRNADGRERIPTIGSFPDWSTAPAREQAKSLKRRVDNGEDPMAEREAARRAQSVAELWAAFETDHLSTLRPSTQTEYRRMWAAYLAASVGKLKIAAVTKEDIAALHRRIAKEHPYQANRVLALASVLFSQAVERKLRLDNPAHGIKKAPEEARETFLTPAELGRINGALAAHPAWVDAGAIRLMLLTGCRRGEALAAKWTEFDLDNATWSKPSVNTKSKRPHRVPLSSTAVQLLREIQAKTRNLRGDVINPYVFTSGRFPAERLTGVKRTWVSACEAAGLTGIRLHDLRHSFASALVSGGLNLPVIGRMLGHSQPRTTARYSHLYDDVLRDAAEHVGQIASGTVVRLPTKRRRQA
jgi:integrase